MSFKEQMTSDLTNSFFNKNEFAEEATLVRNGQRYVVCGLYDEQALQNESVGGEVNAISHSPRLFVSSSSLPGGKPSKGDKFILSTTPFHVALTLVAREFAFEKDGVVVYSLQAAR